MKVTQFEYEDAMKLNELLKNENYILKSNLAKANRRADLLQKDLDDIDDLSAEMEVAILNKLNRGDLHEC